MLLQRRHRTGVPQGKLVTVAALEEWEVGPLPRDDIMGQIREPDTLRPFCYLDLWVPPTFPGIVSFNLMPAGSFKAPLVSNWSSY